jgi:hypothetical protein
MGSGAPTILTSALDGGEGVSFTPRPRYPRVRNLGNNWRGDGVDPRASLHATEYRTIFVFAANRTLAGQTVAIPTELSRLMDKNDDDYFNEEVLDSLKVEFIKFLRAKVERRFPIEF